ncbi:uncharacterized protein K444DRAFT_556103, partial [Hyaloscypha bicolor E]
MSFGFSVGDFVAVLQLANDVRKQFVDAPSQFKAISEEVKSLSIVLQDIDDILPARDLTSHQQTELGNIVKHCESVLEELNKIVINFKELDPIAKSLDKKPRRVWKRFKWDQNDINELRTRISSNILLLNTFLGQVSSQAVFAIRDSIERLHERQDTQERQQETREQQQEDQIILNWLTPVDFVSQQNDFIARRQERTGTWLLDSTEYQSWRQAKKQTLFCPGIPGAGKTIITSIVVEELTTRFRNDNSVGIAYIYCNFRRQDEQKINDLLASLLKQLAEGQPCLPVTVKELYDRHKKNRTRPSLDEILKTLNSVITTYSRVYIVVDALDECQCWSTFLSDIFSLQAKTGVKLFTTSRPIPDIEEMFKECLSLEILASDEDIGKYLNGHMSQLPTFVLRKPELQEEIVTEIVHAVEGMFLLAQLYLGSLEDKTTVKAMKTALMQFQKNSQETSQNKKLEVLSLAYEEAMERINRQQAGFQLLAKNVLSWITCAKRPLTTSELQHALAVEIGESQLDKDNLPEVENMVSVCAGLVTIDDESKIIRLVHYTTQQYFEHTRSQWFPDSLTNITTICVTHLLFKEFESGICQNDKEFEERLRLYPFYKYAAQNWGKHACEASEKYACEASEKVVQLTINLLEDEQKALASTQAMVALGPFPDYSQQRVPVQMTGVHLAVFFEFNEAILALLGKGHHPDCKDSSGQTPLSWAAENGHELVARLLLEKGAELESKDKDNQTPLLWAIRNEHEKMVRLLLEKGAKLESKDK